MSIPRPASYGRLVVREGDGGSYDVELRNLPMVIGRGTGADVRLTDQSVSRRHAEIRIVDGVTTVKDLKSTNGTAVNGMPVTTASLADGDEVRVGETVLTFREPRRG
jgi:pSer/pThr/pTyr-binding forkhead associated (FHA) protein